MTIEIKTTYSDDRKSWQSGKLQIVDGDTINFYSTSFFGKKKVHITFPAGAIKTINRHSFFSSRVDIQLANGRGVIDTIYFSGDNEKVEKLLRKIAHNHV